MSLIGSCGERNRFGGRSDDYVWLVKPLAEDANRQPDNSSGERRLKRMNFRSLPIVQLQSLHVSLRVPAIDDVGEIGADFGAAGQGNAQSC